MAKKTSDLTEYRRRRNFEVTSEPAPGPLAEKPKGAPRTFMVHKHDATRLHYDLRLEIDGALASWAIPKGPSYDPSAKRWAVQTEDHPFEYGNFEGRIPEGEYGAGDSIIWERGTYETVPPGQEAEQRKKGHLHLELQGEKLNGRWHLVRTQGRAGEKPGWLFFKAKDGKENPQYDVVAERPESVHSGRRVTRGPTRKKDLRAAHPPPEKLLEKVWPPMLAVLSDGAGVSPRTHTFEVKYDGYRGIAAVSGGKVGFLTRNAIDLSARFPEIHRALQRLIVGEAVVDGEVVAFDAKGNSRFELLMQPGVDHRFVVFDLLWLDGEDLRQRPLEERRDLLESLLANTPPPIEVSERLEGDVPALMAEAKRRGLEGLLAKERGSHYVGTRSRAWQKLKVTQSQEVAVIGFTPISNGKKEIGALLVGVHEGKHFEYAGKIGTGFSTKLRRELWDRLHEDRLEKSVAVDAPRKRDAVWVKPRFVAQVQFTEWTRDGKLRHPSFQGLREDKRPEETRRELPAHLAPPRASAPAKASPKKQAGSKRRGSTQGGSAASRAKGAKGATGARRAPTKLAARASRAEDQEPLAPAVKLSSADRLVFPKAKLTKGDVFAYYSDVAEVMVPALAGRPLALKQWPKGITHEGFYRQNVPGLPEWATSVEVDTAKRPVKHPIVDRPETLQWLANHNAFELHMWHSRVPHLKEPDWVLFDLDPGNGSIDDLITVAQALHALLEKLGVDSLPKTSGKRGLHVLVPICRGHNYRDTLEFATAITDALGRALPDIATTERSISKRHGRLYLDALQNGEGKTVIAPYSLRGVEGAPVSAPLKWSEVTRRLDSSKFTLKTMRKRLDTVGDLFAPALRGKQRLPRFTR